ncbi:hypothetical protein BK026_17085 [Alteromonas sp. V450]|uniref:RipA family octameric membrane protein n=1 Tax=Alteromonas sp. V450 TaxID=1912139 RepID=UPI0008FF27FE|nr:hypothetical protein [Alteromonas sp. V450]OJF70351.1 hypothetical protein BK026_17085 [Alteromonas sp. V450]
MSDDKKTQDKAFEVALATRNFEIELFWKRSVFFWGFIASSFVGYASLIKASSGLSVVIACFGFVCSFAWALVNRGSKRWQENWELIVADLEDEVTGSLFTKRESKCKGTSWLSARNYSVSKVTIALSDFTVLIWLALIVWHVMRQFCSAQISESVVVLMISVASIIYAVLIAVKGRSSD